MRSGLLQAYNNHFEFYLGLGRVPAGSTQTLLWGPEGQDRITPCPIEGSSA